MKELESESNFRSTLDTRYHVRLRDMPAPGQGRHTALLAIANLGIMAGALPEQIHEDIRRAVNGGSQLPDIAKYAPRF